MPAKINLLKRYTKSLTCIFYFPVYFDAGCCHSVLATYSSSPHSPLPRLPRKICMNIGDFAEHGWSTWTTDALDVKK